MFGAAYDAVIHEPLRNAIVFLIDVAPGASLGLAIIALTIVVRLVLFPLSKRAILSQIRMKEIEPEIAALKVRLKDNPQQLALETMKLYRERGVKPFASIGMLLIQLPILIGLYTVFRESFDSIDPATLYSFVSVPAAVDSMFLGVDLRGAGGAGLAFAVVAGILQHVASRLTLRYQAAPTGKPGESFQADFARSMRFQMLYIFPALPVLISIPFVAAIPLYWAVGNLFTVLQELYLAKHRKAAVRAN